MKTRIRTTIIKTKDGNKVSILKLRIYNKLRRQKEKASKKSSIS